MKNSKKWLYAYFYKNTPFKAFVSGKKGETCEMIITAGTLVKIKEGNWNKFEKDLKMEK
jgi:hypothetical protein